MIIKFDIDKYLIYLGNIDKYLELIYDFFDDYIW